MFEIIEIGYRYKSLYLVSSMNLYFRKTGANTLELIIFDGLKLWAE